jgi:hypothetical protein
MKACYLLRFDDLCPTLHWELWAEVEAILLRNDICPLLAVVPDNQDPELKCAAPAVDFWERVRTWQARGWTIALHGFQHKFVTADAGLVGLNRCSEFAGLPAQTQKEKLAQALSIFRQEGISTEVWAAPAHSFDHATLHCLLEFGLQVVSDGLFLYPQTDPRGLFWMPQQLSDFRSFPFGVFTICFHLNHWNRARLQFFERQIVAYRSRITSLREIKAMYSHRQPRFDAVRLTKWGGAALKLKQRLRLRQRISSLQSERQELAG